MRKEEKKAYVAPDVDYAINGVLEGVFASGIGCENDDIYDGSTLTKKSICPSPIKGMFD